jgi:hypothetical protein
MDDDTISRIKAALEAGPTSGEWDADFASAMRNGAPAVVEYFVRRDGEDISIAADIVDPETGLPSQANADYIAAVNPATIRALLDRLKAAEAEIERLSVLAVDQKGVLRDLLADVAVMKQRLAEANLDKVRLLKRIAAVENTNAR